MSSLLEDTTEETLAAIAKAQTSGITVATGITSYDLSPLISLVPVVTPFRDHVSRQKSTDGAPYAVWRALMNVTSSQPDPSMGLDYAANEVQILKQDFQAKYMPTGLSGFVTQDSFDLATGYADLFAEDTFQTLNQVLIGDDRKLLGAQSFPLAAATAPTLTQHATGGTIGAVTPFIGVAARTGSGYYYGSGNSQGASNSTTFGSGSTNSISATTPAIRGAVCYDWFYSATGAANSWFYYTTTTVNAVTITAPITSNNALPTTLPDLQNTFWKGSNASAIPTYNGSADNGSANANDYDGYLASLSGDYTTVGQWAQPGTATTNPAIWNSLNGAALTLSGGSVAEIENNLFVPLWNAVKCSPTALMMNAAQAQEIANLVLGSSSATTFLNTDAQGRISVTAGGRVGEIVNAPAGGVTVPIEVHVSLPPGTIIARSDRVPFPQSRVSSVLEFRTLRDTAQFDYGISRVAGTAGGGPRREYEIRTIGAFVNRVPGAAGVLSNIA